MNYRIFKKIIEEVITLDRIKTSRLYGIHYDNEIKIMLFTDKEFKRYNSLQRILLKNKNKNNKNLKKYLQEIENK